MYSVGSCFRKRVQSIWDFFKPRPDVSIEMPLCLADKKRGDDRYSVFWVGSILLFKVQPFKRSNPVLNESWIIV